MAKKKRAKVSDRQEEIAPAEKGLFAPTEPGAEPQRKPDRPNRVLSRATYDMTPALKTAVAKRATRLGIPASQLAAFLLADALRRLDAGKIDPSPYLIESDSPKFANNLSFGDWYHLGDDE